MTQQGKKNKNWRKIICRLLDASQNKGSAIKEDTQQMVSQISFAHLDGNQS